MTRYQLIAKIVTVTGFQYASNTECASKAEHLHSLAVSRDGANEEDALQNFYNSLCEAVTYANEGDEETETFALEEAYGFAKRVARRKDPNKRFI